jgi:hypothetical protein
MSSASTVLPLNADEVVQSAEIVSLPIRNHKADIPRNTGFTKANVAKMRCPPGAKEVLFLIAKLQRPTLSCRPGVYTTSAVRSPRGYMMPVWSRSSSKRCLPTNSRALLRFIIALRFESPSALL